MGKNTRLIILAVSILFGIFVIFSLVSNLKFRVSSTTPDLDSVSTASPFVKIHFNKDIAADYDITSESSIITGTKLESDKRTVTLTLTGLEPRQDYTVVINYVRSVGGEEIRGKKLAFVAKVIDVNKLSKEEKQALIEHQNQGSPNTVNDPILSLLPYHAPNYDIEAVVSDSDVSLVVTIRLSKADMANKEAAINMYKQQALDQIISSGADVNRHSIRYVVE